MTLLSPIRGLCPPPELAADVAELPYDVMNRDEAVAMASGREHSFLHVSRPDIDLPPDTPATSGQAYQLAAAAFERLQTDGMLVRAPQAQFHVYRLTQSGRSQTGVFGGASVAAYDDGRIRRHETTRPDKQADRAAQIEAVGAQTGPAFLIHRTSSAIAALVKATTAEPAATSFIGPGGVHHEVWAVTEPSRLAGFTTAFNALDALYIADGHHRSAAASKVHEDLGTPASEVFLAVAFPADEVRLLPYNRVVRGPDGVSPEQLLAQIRAAFAVTPAAAPVSPDTPGDYGLYLDGTWYHLSAGAALSAATDPVDRLDVALLQREVLAPVFGIGDPRTDPNIGFVGGVRPLTQLAAVVDSGQWTAAFSLHPTTVSDLIAVADAGGIMPPKSTWFEPKLLDGLVSHVLDPAPT